ncbi:MAG: universal stress protein [Anaerosomatales bacterium]|nr:universal stress protein [Anaerosomatales bacterium]
MAVFERAAICTDLTQSSASVVACAGALGELGIREAVLIHVIDVRSAALSDVPHGNVFERQARLLEEAGIAVTVDAGLGYPAYEIETIADRHRADVIVIGSHRSGLFPEAFSGSTSSDVVRISTRPVLVVALEILGSPEQSRTVCSRLLASALFLTDLSSRSEVAARYLLSLARTGLRSVDLVHVVPLGERSPADRAREAADRLGVLAVDLEVAGAEARVCVVHGRPVAVATDRVRSGSYSLVLVAPHEQPPGLPALDSVTNAVIKNTEAPVLVIPPRCQRSPGA